MVKPDSNLIGLEGLMIDPVTDLLKDLIQPGHDHSLFDTQILVAGAIIPGPGPNVTEHALVQPPLERLPDGIVPAAAGPANRQSDARRDNLSGEPAIPLCGQSARRMAIRPRPAAATVSSA